MWEVSLCDASLSRSEEKHWCDVCNVRVCTQDENCGRFSTTVQNHLCQSVRACSGVHAACHHVLYTGVLSYSHMPAEEKRQPNVLQPALTVARQDMEPGSHRQCPHRPLYSYTTLNLTKTQLTKTALSCSYKASCNVKHSPVCHSSISVKPTGVKTKSSLNLIKDVKKQFWKIHHRLPS